MRPEAHGLHHERGIHAYNYANVPLWDVVFGTYRNPAGFPEHYGFWQGASSRMGAMLVGRDVGHPASIEA
jgi:sterol desaturase/sphingolipid hydroxylase (fatty acid hydroxylase superfamily)